MRRWCYVVTTSIIKIPLELPGVVERAAGVLTEGRSCLRRYLIFVMENVGFEDSRDPWTS